MIAVVTVLLAFPLGFFLHSHLNANVAYAIAYLWAFTYQGVVLIREWVGGDTSAFPKDPDTIPISYGIVAAAIFAVGFGLVAFGHRLGSKRRTRSALVA
jgi:hypothetical protein